MDKRTSSVKTKLAGIRSRYSEGSLGTKIRNLLKNKKAVIAAAGILAAVIIAVVLVFALRPTASSSTLTAPGNSQAAAVQLGDERAENITPEAEIIQSPGGNSGNTLLSASADASGDAGNDANKKSEAKAQSGNKKNQTSSEKSKICKITINNGASSANTDQAVNGLHVYDPNTEDLEDVFSGQELPAGTTLNIYVYNLASPVSLHVEHNGKTIADRTYSTLEAWVDDDKVEFIQVVLEGDLLVETKALDDDVKAESEISINNEALGKVIVGEEEVHDGDILRNGSADITVERTSADVKAAISVDGASKGSATLTESESSHVFRNIEFNNSDIKVEFTPVDDSVKVPQAPQKSTVYISGSDLAQVYRGSNRVQDGDSVTNGTYDFRVTSSKKDIEVSLYVGNSLVGSRKLNGGGNEYTFSGVNVNGDVTINITDVTPETDETSFTVNVENNVSSSDALMTVGFVNDQEKAEDIVSGRKYDKELMIGARALNYNSDKKLVLTAYGSDGRKIDSVTVGTGTRANPGANGFYITLSDHTDFVLDYEGNEGQRNTAANPGGFGGNTDYSGNTETSSYIDPWSGYNETTESNTDYVNGTDNSSDKNSKTDNTKTSDTKKKNTSSSKKKNNKEKTTAAAEKFKVSVKNGAASANTDEAVNGLHVYDLNDPDLADIEGSKKLKKGTKIRIFAYPLASDIHLKIVHNGKTIVDKDIKKMIAWEDDDKIEFFNITLKGKLTVTTSELKKGGNSGSAKTTQKQTEPDTQKPTKPATQKPTEPDTQKPTEPATQKPTELATQKPTEPATQQPSESATEEYSVSIKNNSGVNGITFTVGWADESSGTPKQIVLKDGDKVEKGTMVGARVINPTSQKLLLKQLDSSGKEIQKFEIPAGSTGNEGVGGFYIDSVEEDIFIVLEKND